MKIICLYLPDNKDFGRLNINGNFTVDLINNCKKPTYLSFTEIQKSSMYSLAVHDKIDLIINKYNDDYYNNYNKCKCKCHKNNFKLLRDININCEEYMEIKKNENISKKSQKYNQKESQNKIQEITLTCTATAEYDRLKEYDQSRHDNNYNFFTYELVGSCNHKFSTSKFYFNGEDEIYKKDKPKEALKSLIQTNILTQLNGIKSCTQCKNNNFINKNNITILPQHVVDIIQFSKKKSDTKRVITYTSLDKRKRYRTLEECLDNIKNNYLDKYCDICGTKFIFIPRYLNFKTGKYVNITDIS